MEKEIKIIEWIGKKRYEHSLRVMETAIKLAEQYHMDIEKTEVAAYYHDCAKIKDRDKLLSVAKAYGLELTEDMKGAPEIIHGFLGAIVAEKDYGIEDEDVLNAIRYHTTGRENMSQLEKVIFLADYIEPGRNFQGIEEIRKMAFVNLDRALLAALNNTIKFLMEENNYIALLTIRARNYILFKR